MRISKPQQRYDIPRVQAQCRLEQTARFACALEGERLVPDRAGTQHQIQGIELIPALMHDTPTFGGNQLKIHRPSEVSRDLILQVEETCARFVKTFGPQLQAGFDLVELGIYTDPVAIQLHTPRHDIAHTKLLANRSDIDRLVTVVESRVAPDHEHVGDAGQIRRQILGNAIDQVVLAIITAEICERQHDDRKSGYAGRLRLFTFPEPSRESIVCSSEQAAIGAEG